MMVGRDAPEWDGAAAVGDTRGHPRALRLLYIAEAAPALRAAAARAAADAVRRETHDVQLYIAACELAHVAPDAAWIEATTAHVADEHAQLIAELRMYQNNMIAESVRMAHSDLGDHFVRTGRFADALLNYDKAREYSTTHEHMLEANMRAMYAAHCLRVPDAAAAYADKAALALHALPATALPGHNDAWRAVLASGGAVSGGAALGPRAAGASGAATASSSTGTDVHAQLDARIRAVRTLALWEICDAAAVLPAVDAGDGTGSADIVPPALLAWLAALGALSDPASTTRAQRLADDAAFKRLSESDAGPRELVHAFLAGDMRRTLALVSAHAPALALEPTLGARVPLVLESIAQRMLARYLSAYRRISVGRLARVFGWDDAHTRRELLTLALSGRLDVHIDWPAQAVALCESGADTPARVLADGCATAQLRDRLVLSLRMEAAGHIVGN